MECLRERLYRIGAISQATGSDPFDSLARKSTFDQVYGKMLTEKLMQVAYRRKSYYYATASEFHMYYDWRNITDDEKVEYQNMRDSIFADAIEWGKSQGIPTCYISNPDAVHPKDESTRDDSGWVQFELFPGDHYEDEQAFLNSKLNEMRLEWKISVSQIVKTFFMDLQLADISPIILSFIFDMKKE
jgi:hypothetical protein